MIYTAIQEMQAGNGIINIPQVITNLRQQRKWMITNKVTISLEFNSIFTFVSKTNIGEYIRQEIHQDSLESIVGIKVL